MSITISAELPVRAKEQILDFWDSDDFWDEPIEDVVIPLGTVRKFLKRWDETFLNDLDEIVSDFELPIKYPKKERAEIFWGEMSYNYLTDTSLTWNYSYYSGGGEWE